VRDVDGSSYAFAALTMEDTEDPKVGDLGDELRAYEHLQHLYMKGNDIRDIGSIAHLYHLLTVNFNTNSISSIRFFEELGGDNTRLQFLQVRKSQRSISHPTLHLIKSIVLTFV
jgi:Leucine-rich repeat (LRR) protein